MDLFLSNDVFSWPEFQAFVQRLGIPCHLDTTGLELSLQLNEPVRIEHSYHATPTPNQNQTRPETTPAKPLKGMNV
jgi:hypothetical protein